MVKADKNPIITCI